MGEVTWVRSCLGASGKEGVLVLDLGAGSRRPAVRRPHGDRRAGPKQKMSQ